MKITSLRFTESHLEALSGFADTLGCQLSEVVRLVVEATVPNAAPNPQRNAALLRLVAAANPDAAGYLQTRLNNAQHAPEPRDLAGLLVLLLSESAAFEVLETGEVLTTDAERTELRGSNREQFRFELHEAVMDRVLRKVFNRPVDVEKESLV